MALPDDAAALQNQLLQSGYVAERGLAVTMRLMESRTSGMKASSLKPGASLDSEE